MNSSQSYWRAFGRRYQFLLSSVVFVVILLALLGQVVYFQTRLIRITALEQADHFATEFLQQNIVPGAETFPAVRMITEQNLRAAPEFAPNDLFEREALVALRKNPTAPVWQFSTVNNRRILRYVTSPSQDAQQIMRAYVFEIPAHAAWGEAQIGTIGLGASVASLAMLVGLIQVFGMRRVRRVQETMDERVFERTAALTAANLQLERGISERESAEKGLSAVLDTVSEGIISVDHNACIVMVNREANSIWGYNPGELIEARIEEIISGDVNPIKAFIQRMMHEKDSPSVLDKRFETVGKRKDNTTFPLEVGITFTAIEDQRLFTIAARDITLRRRIEDELREERTMLAQRVEARTVELRRANVQLERAAQMKDEFLASMSHELRTPLNAILGLSEAMQSEIYGDLDERMHRPLQLVRDSGHHLLDLINDILDVSKIAAGQLQLQKEKVLVSQVCGASLSMVRQTAEAKDIIIRFEPDPNVKILHGDDRRLKQILVNLLSNAVKFTPAGGAVGLKVRGDRKSNRVYFTVVDTGIGIAREDFGRLFDPFVQVDSSLSRKFNGSGLGLALVRRLSELHGGSVSVESKVNHGSRFIVTLPWEMEESTEPESYLEEFVVPVRKVKASNHPTLILQGRRPQVLLAEDNEVNVETVMDYLEYRGFDVTVARDGIEAIELSSREPDIILMDIQMPRMDGLEATRRIRVNPRTADIPIIALTGLAMSGDRERCLSAGADDYVSKPFQLEKLIKVMERQLPDGTMLMADGVKA